MSVNLDLAVWCDYETGEGGGMYALMVHAGAVRTPAEAARVLETHGPIKSRPPTAVRKSQEHRHSEEAAMKRALAASLWTKARPLSGSLAETYLRARAVTAPIVGAELRFLPAVRAWTDDRPAMIARVSDADGRGIAVHLTFLQRDGSGKSDLDRQRKMIGRVTGGHVSLAPGSHIVVGEGIETSLSAWEFCPGEARRLGCIASLSAGGMTRLVWPRGTTGLIIAPDNDAAGQDAAQALAERAFRAGLDVGFLKPPSRFNDWNDVLAAKAKS
jgi:hypothetical protein